MGRARRMSVGGAITLARRHPLGASANAPTNESAGAVLVPGTPWHALELKKYCERLLDVAGVGVGDVFAVALEDSSQEPLALALADACARRRALVEVLCRTDNALAASQIEGAVSSHGVIMNIQSYHSQLPASAAANPEISLYEAYDNAQKENTLRWNVAMCPTPAWAQEVYPELDENAAFLALGQDLLSFVRVSAEDDEGAWEQHLQTLHTRAHKLNKAGVRQLHVHGQGTDLRLCVLEGAHYLPVEWETKTGKRVCVNTPTEEIFTTPDPFAVEGVFATSRPLVLAGEKITAISGHIIAGELSEISCPNRKHNQLLQNVFFGDDPSIRRLGEIGLVDTSNRIAASGRIYNNNTIDENAGTHLGFGDSYEAALTAAGEAAGVCGNRSDSHIDLIVGGPELSIDGTNEDGDIISLISAGQWAL